MSNALKSNKEKRREDFEEQVINIFLYFIITISIVLMIRLILHLLGVMPMWIIPTEEIILNFSI